MKVEEIKVKRTDVEFLIGESKVEDKDIPLSLFKNKDVPWILTDGWNGISYFITDDEYKKILDDLK